MIMINQIVVKKKTILNKIKKEIQKKAKKIKLNKKLKIN